MIANPTASRAASLSQERRNSLEAEILKRFSAPKKSLPQQKNPSIPAPLSYAQESLWFFDKLQPKSALYNIPQAFRLTGPLDLQSLHRAFEQIVERHEALRTAFICVDEKPFQIIQEKRFSLNVIDYNHIPVSQREVEIKKVLDDEAMRPFNLAEDLLLRASLLCFSDKDHVLTLSLHHIISDFGSLEILYRELTTLYHAFLSGNPDPLPPLSCQFSDFAFSQRQRLQNSLPLNCLEYWKKNLAGDLPVLELPLGRPRPSQQTFKGSRVTIHIPAVLTSRLKKFALEEGVTPYMLLLSAFKLLLSRYSSQEDIIVGVPVGERTPLTQELIGFFINTLPVRTDFSGDPTFRELLGRVRMSALGTLSNGGLPLEMLVEQLRLSRNGSRNPVFQTVFQYLATPSPRPELSGITAEPLPMETATAKFDLTFTLVEANDGIKGDMEFNTDLFEACSISRLLQHFQVLLEAAIATPHQVIGQLPVLTEAELQLLTKSWSGSVSQYPKDASIHEMLTAQVQKTPEAPAVIFGDTHLTYRQLNEQANRVANYLLENGVSPESRVGICMERSFELIISLLGILKAGAAYVPLDAASPAERLSFFIKDTSASVILTTSQFKNAFPTSEKILCYDLEREQIALESPSDPPVDVSAHSLAYIMYTSGSTGKPKGVAIPHRGVVRLVQNTDYISFTPDDVFLQFAPVSFDASTLEIWGPLLNGAKLAVFPPRFESIEQLGEVLHRYGVTTLWLTAGLFHQVVEHHIECLKGVRQLFAGGDVLSVSHVVKVLDHLPNTRLVNGYGPTENTTFTCCYPVPVNWRGRSVPIGRPISNTQVYILDKNLLPVPIDVPGELYIAGDGLAREYLNSPGLTAERFVPNPFSTEKSARLYRTGDIVRWLDDGNIEFIGRRDNQVKIRGFRVELGEIENVIAEHEGIAETVLTATNDAVGTKSLVAYLVLKPGTTADERHIRAYCEKVLPGYMCPQHYVILDKFPLTPNGKVDRRLLPVPQESARTVIVVPPRNPNEQTIARIWTEVLKLPDVGIEDNFFELGGHSLLATRIVSRINEALGANLSLASLFEFPTIAGLSKAVENSRKTTPPLAPITRRSRR